MFFQASALVFVACQFVSSTAVQKLVGLVSLVATLYYFLEYHMTPEEKESIRGVIARVAWLYWDHGLKLWRNAVVPPGVPSGTVAHPESAPALG